MIQNWHPGTDEVTKTRWEEYWKLPLLQHLNQVYTAFDIRMYCCNNWVQWTEFNRGKSSKPSIHSFWKWTLMLHCIEISKNTNQNWACAYVTKIQMRFRRYTTKLCIRIWTKTRDLLQPNQSCNFQTLNLFSKASILFDKN